MIEKLKLCSIAISNFIDEFIQHHVNDGNTFSRSLFVRDAVHEFLQERKDLIAKIDNLYDIEYFAQQTVLTVNIDRNDIIELEKHIEDFVIEPSRSEFIRNAVMSKIIRIINKDDKNSFKLHAQNQIAHAYAGIPPSVKQDFEKKTGSESKLQRIPEAKKGTMPRLSKEQFQMLMEGKSQ